MEEVNTAPQL